MTMGVIVGADITQEWLLPWWWEHYRKHNAYPVAFIDFGMSFEKKDWCKKRGKLIPLRMLDDFVKERSEIDPKLVHQWETDSGDKFWDARKAWFKKPFACLKSPFQRTIWIDLDCEIRGSLENLFHYVNHPIGLSLARDYQFELIYNAGVIAFCPDSKLLKEWSEQCLEKTHLYRDDQELLSNMIKEKQIPFLELPLIYNWSRMREENPNAIIQHWHGLFGKIVIRQQIAQSS